MSRFFVGFVYTGESRKNSLSHLIMSELILYLVSGDRNAWNLETFPSRFIPKVDIKQEYRDMQNQHICKKCVCKLDPTIVPVEAAADCVLSLLEEDVSGRLNPYLFIQPSLLIMRQD